MKKHEKIKLFLIKITTIILIILILLLIIKLFVFNHFIVDKIEKIVYERKMRRLAIVCLAVGFIHIFLLIKNYNIVKNSKIQKNN